MIEKFRGKHRWLSNFWAAPVMLDGLLYPTTEHAYQAGKTLDPQVRETIRRLPTAALAKRFGRRFGRSLQFWPGWNDAYRTQLMCALLKQKFEDPDLRRRLLDTGEEPLIESGHWHDVFWGRCSCAKCGGKGQNRLGILLAEIRAECRAKDAANTTTAHWRLDDAA